MPVNKEFRKPRSPTARVPKHSFKNACPNKSTKTRVQIIKFQEPQVPTLACRSPCYRSCQQETQGNVSSNQRRASSTRTLTTYSQKKNRTCATKRFSVRYCPPTTRRKRSSLRTET
ncbi:unnamed protein product, partial [Ectocarpus sp. 12 AP-2014]